jgi:hypothetical protein
MLYSDEGDNMLIRNTHHEDEGSLLIRNIYSDGEDSMFTPKFC